MTTKTTQNSASKNVVDQNIRDRILNELNTNFVVQAGAGAGKTTLLIDRMIAQIESGNFKIGQLVAITFTKKAAGEMRTRFVSALNEKIQAEKHVNHAEKEANDAKKHANIDGKTFAHLTEAQENVDQCFMGTIHAFCTRILRECALEVGLPADFVTLEPLETEKLTAEFWRKWLAGAYKDSNEALNHVIKCQIDPISLYEAFKKRNDYRDVAMPTDKLDRPEFKAVIAIKEILIAAQAQAKSKNTTCKVTQFAYKWLPLIDQRPNMVWSDRMALITSFVKSCWNKSKSCANITLKFWDDNKIAKEYRDEIIPELYQQLLPEVQAYRAWLYAQIVTLFDAAVIDFTVDRKKQGKFTFDDLLLFTAEVLRNYSTIRRRMQSRYKTLMVDEFQDTDPVQAEIVFLLAGEPQKDNDWRSVQPSPGSLFVVGDAKQSIYRFRRADIRIFQDVAEQMQKTGGRVETLTTNFRSVENLCRVWNTGFKDVFEAILPPIQADFAPLDAYHPASTSNPFLRIPVAKLHRHDATNVAAIEATTIANYIQAQVDANQYSYNDFLILTRADKRLKNFKDALVKKTIPVDPVGGSMINDSAVLMGLFHLVNCAYHPEKPIYWVKVLRGIFCGLSDDALYQIKKANIGFDYRAVISDELATTEHGKLMLSIQDLMFELAHNLMHLPPADALKRLIDQLNLMPFFRHQQTDFETPASLVRLIALVTEWQSAGGHWGEILEKWTQYLAQKKEKVGLITNVIGQGTGVRIMNVHQAKGLQASVVILADSCGASNIAPKMFIQRLNDTVSFYSPIEVKGSPIAMPLAWPQILEEAKAYDEAEKDRLLYVAATRAKEKVILCDYAVNTTKKTWAKLDPQFLTADTIESVDDEAVSTAANKPENRNTRDKISQIKRIEMMQAAGGKSYQETSVTKLKEQQGTGFEGSSGLKGGYGKAYGTAVHDLIEQLIVNGGKQPDQEAIKTALETALEKEPEEKKAANVSEMIHAATKGLKAFADAEVMQAVKASDQVFTEVPFSIMIKGEGGEVLLLKGIIDLVYRTPAGWHIIDYKTDGVQSESDLKILWQMYKSQVMIYKKYWQQLAGETVVNTALWSVPFAKMVGE